MTKNSSGPLNPKKSHFSLKEGNILGRTVSKDGVKIDPKRLISIQDLTLPRRFILNFSEVVKHITCMLKKEKEVKWKIDSINSFELIKKSYH